MCNVTCAGLPPDGRVLARELVWQWPWPGVLVLGAAVLAKRDLPAINHLALGAIFSPRRPGLYIDDLRCFDISDVNTWGPMEGTPPFFILCSQIHCRPHHWCCHQFWQVLWLEERIRNWLFQLDALESLHGQWFQKTSMFFFRIPFGII